MEFISLNEALEGIAACVSVHEFSEYPVEQKISSAAGLLHQLLNNTPEERPLWAEINSTTKRPLFSDAALSPEGMEILLHTAGWYEREWQNHVKHITHLAICQERGVDLSLVIKGHSMNDGQYPRLQLLRPYGMGFDRSELIEFLDSNQIAHTLEQQNSMPAAATSSASNAANYDFSLLATRAQLIDCFGRYTDMSLSWFGNLKDAPRLHAARKVKGQGGRGHIQEPRFCPLEVMQWLIDDKRRKGRRRLSAEKAWTLLEQDFPNVYNKYSACDPRTSD